jgi:hypothetical protein
MQRLIDANTLLKQPLDIANYPSNYIKEAPTVLTIPEQPTNGDMQQAILPKHWEWGTNGNFVHVWGDGQTMTFTLEWWNSPYKRGNEDGSIRD